MNGPPIHILSATALVFREGLKHFPVGAVRRFPLSGDGRTTEGQGGPSTFHHRPRCGPPPVLCAHASERAGGPGYPASPARQCEDGRTRRSLSTDRAPRPCQGGVAQPGHTACEGPQEGSGQDRTLAVACSAKWALRSLRVSGERLVIVR